MLVGLLACTAQAGRDAQLQCCSQGCAQRDIHLCTDFTQLHAFSISSLITPLWPLFVPMRAVSQTILHLSNDRRHSITIAHCVSLWRVLLAGWYHSSRKACVPRHLAIVQPPLQFPLQQ